MTSVGKDGRSDWKPPRRMQDGTKRCRCGISDDSTTAYSTSPVERHEVNPAHDTLELKSLRTQLQSVPQGSRRNNKTVPALQGEIERVGLLMCELSTTIHHQVDRVQEPFITDKPSCALCRLCCLEDSFF